MTDNEKDQGETWYVVFTVKSGRARAKFRDAVDAADYIDGRADLDMRREAEMGALTLQARSALTPEAAYAYAQKAIAQFRLVAK